ncbi:MAG: NAD(P)H-hydrate dehydratase [Phycisphaerae bacterium]
MRFEPVITHDIPPLPPRRDDAHKGEAGRIVIIGGQHGEVTMVGAVALAARAAFRAGCGTVQMIVPAPLQTAAVTLAPCATAHRLNNDAGKLLDAVAGFMADVLAVGPGMGDSVSGSVLADVICGFPGPIVLDADALNLVATLDAFEPPGAERLIITPHIGEMRRLLTGRGINAPPQDRTEAARALVAAYHGVVVLKGMGTIVTDGDRLYVNKTGNPGMATGGTGDVLTGVIAALLGQGMTPFHASVLGVYLHGLAGDHAADALGRRAMTAADVVEFLPHALQAHERRT